MFLPRIGGLEHHPSSPHGKLGTWAGDNAGLSTVLPRNTQEEYPRKAEVIHPLVDY